MLATMEERIKKVIKKTLIKLGANEISFTVERPVESAYGDYTTNVAMVVAKKLEKKPRELADELIKILKDELPEAQKIEVAGSGFINITLTRDAINLQIAEADVKDENWGKGNAQTGKRIMIEYSNPNAFKEMHIGHLMGSVIGESLSRLIENAGAEVIRDTFGGDIGPNVAKTLWSLRKRGMTNLKNVHQIGEAYTEGSQAYETDPKAKEEIDALNKALYKAEDHELMKLWRVGRDISMEAFERLWKIFGTKFDYTFFDSDTAESGLRIVREGLKKGIFKESNGAIIYDGEDKEVHTMVFITSHGTPTYEAKDIGLSFLKEERCISDKIIIVSGIEQKGRFKTVRAALADIAPNIAEKTTYIANGFLKLKSGKMSSREGNVITAEELLQKVIEKASEKNPDSLIAEQVAVGAIKFMILRQSPGQDIIFDFERSLSLTGDSGPYMQYALVRAKKILAYASGGEGDVIPTEPYAVERVIMHFPEIADRAAREMAPNLLVTYLLELAASWNSFYGREQILGSPEEAYKQRVARAFAHTMTNGLTLLGIPTPDRM